MNIEDLRELYFNPDISIWELCDKYNFTRYQFNKAFWDKNSLSITNKKNRQKEYNKKNKEQNIFFINENISRIKKHLWINEKQIYSLYKKWWTTTELLNWRVENWKFIWVDLYII